MLPRTAGGAIVLVALTACVALTASNSVPVTYASERNSPVTADDVKPLDCTAPATALAAGSGAVAGSLGNDLLTGSAGPDTLAGLGGDDCLLGGDGLDVLDGGPGVDVCLGGPGVDTFVGCETAIEG